MMNVHVLLHSMLATIGLAASVTFTQQIQTPQFAILNLPSGAYLQMDVQGLSGSEEPRIDTIRVRVDDVAAFGGVRMVTASLMVFWEAVPLTVKSDEPITSAQVIQKIELPAIPACSTCADTPMAFHVDTISYATYTSSALRRQIDPPHVDDQSLTPHAYCTVSYSFPECFSKPEGCKTDLVKAFAKEWKGKAFASIIEPSPFSSRMVVPPHDSSQAIIRPPRILLTRMSDWTQTGGMEEIQGIVTPLPGNASNWINVSRVRFDTRSVLKPFQDSIPGSGVAQLPTWSIPDGAVRYVYNRTASPDLKILENDDHRVIGTLLKIGHTIEASRKARPGGCLPPIVDTTMGKSSWLVLADSASEDALERALLPSNYPFGSGRESAWRISGDTVWLDRSTTILLADLLAAVQTSSRTSATPATARCRLARTPDGLALDLDRAAEIRAVSASGRILSGWARHPSGRTALPTIQGAAYMQVRAAGFATTLPALR